MAGRLISLRPARGPEESSRRSLQIFDTWGMVSVLVSARRQGQGQEQ